jgi:hypothetical protein
MATMWVRPAAVDLATLVPGVTVLSGLALATALGLLFDGSHVSTARNDFGITPCPTSAQQDLLSAHALQCWFPAPGGRWRTLARVSAHGALVVEVEATALSDAELIARQFVTDRGGKFSEVLVYAQRESAVPPLTIRRIRWTQITGFEQFEFTTPAR